MKKYIKTINNKTVVKSLKDIIIFKNDMQIINPKESQVLADGWELYVTPAPTQEEIIAEAKKSKIDELLEYDSSSNVNSFYISQMPLWLDKATRSGLILRFQAEREFGAEKTTLWYEGIPFELPMDNAIGMLFLIERYASECYDNTQRHLGTINALSDLEEIEHYDFTSGYPEKLQF